MATRVGLYARVSTNKRDTDPKRQDPDTQLLPLRQFAQAQGYEVVGEYIDRVSAVKVRSRTAWKRLLDDAAKRRVDIILCWKMDRCFRSIRDAIETVNRLKDWGVGLRSYSEPWMDTSGQNATGKLMFTILAGFAEFERDLTAERVRTALDRVREYGSKSGNPIGRPRALNGEWNAVAPLVLSGQLSQTAAAKQLRVSQATISRLCKKVAESAPRQSA
jgi:DNA invertase Pin-like site-specific DNA recombinase